MGQLCHTFAQKSHNNINCMTYREYLLKCSFDEIWEVIRAAYDEPVEIKPLYRRLYDSIISFPKLNTEEIMVVYTDSFSEPAVANCLAPYEELADREVELSFDLIDEISDVQIAAHLLWWSSIFSLRTAEERSDCILYASKENWARMDPKVNGELEAHKDEWVHLKELWDIDKRSSKRKLLRFWRDTILDDFNSQSLRWLILRKLEYSIGYWNFFYQKRLKRDGKWREIASYANGIQTLEHFYGWRGKGR